jgi:hypothetical protein
MVALDTRWLTGASSLHYETFDSPLGEVHRQAQADRAATDDQHLGLAGPALNAWKRILNHIRSVRYLASDVQNAGDSFGRNDESQDLPVGSPVSVHTRQRRSCFPPASGAALKRRFPAEEFAPVEAYNQQVFPAEEPCDGA